MPLTRVVRSKGAVITMEVHAEVLFTPNGPLGNFARQFTQRVKTATAANAPGNSRPTWGHEPAAHGKPLKASFRAATRYRPATAQIFSAIGSSAAYAPFVDQGTGIYNEGSPWRAKILPPTSQMGSDLYEHTWRPGGGRQGVGEVWIKGQKPQYFFAKGLDAGLASMGLPAIKVPGGSGTTAFPKDLSRHVSAAIDTGRGSAFRASLEQWRRQRDAAWNRGEALGRTGSNAHTRETDRRAAASAERYRKNRARLQRNKPTDEQIRTANRERQRKFREQIAKAKGKTIKRKPPQQIRETYRTVGDKKKAALKAFHKKNPRVKVLRQVGGGIVVSANGRTTTITWAQLFGLL